MTIEPSVLIWTVLCFLALLLIVKKLLFQPMLTFMDARSAKIEAARAAKAQAQHEREAEISRRQEEYAAEEARQHEQGVAALESLHTESLRLTAEKRSETARRLDADRTALGAESERIRGELEPKLPGLALDLVNHLQQWQDDSHSAVDAEIVAAPYADIEMLHRQQHLSPESIQQDDLQRLAEEYAAEDRRALQKAAAVLEEVWLDAKDLSAQHRSEFAERLKKEEAALEEESDSIQHELEPQLSELANAFIQRLQKWEAEDAAETDGEHADVSMLTHLLGENDPTAGGHKN